MGWILSVCSLQVPSFDYWPLTVRRFQRKRGCKYWKDGSELRNFSQFNHISMVHFSLCRKLHPIAFHVSYTHFFFTTTILTSINVKAFQLVYPKVGYLFISIVFTLLFNFYNILLRLMMMVNFSEKKERKKEKRKIWSDRSDWVTEKLPSQSDISSDINNIFK